MWNHVSGGLSSVVGAAGEFVAVALVSDGVGGGGVQSLSNVDDVPPFAGSASGDVINEDAARGDFRAADPVHIVVIDEIVHQPDVCL